MDDNKALAVSATMVGLAAIASGAFFFSSRQAGASESVVVPQPAEVIVEYLDVNGNHVVVPTTYETVDATGSPPASTADAAEPLPEYEEHESEEYESEAHEEDEHEAYEEGEHEEHEEEEYESEEYEYEYEEEEEHEYDD